MFSFVSFCKLLSPKVGSNLLALPAAALAGLLSFLSPCVLPLVPPYLTFIAGTSIEEVAIHQEVVR